MSDPKKFLDYEGLTQYHNLLEPSRVHNALTGFTTAAGNATSGSYLSVKWTLPDVDGITEPYDGMKVLIRIPLAGVGTAGTVLSIDGGTTYHPVAYNATTAFTSHYAVNTVKLFIYHATQSMACYLSSNTKSTITGIWQGESNYVDGNTVITYGTLAYYHRPYAANSIYRYKLTVVDKDNRLVPLTAENVTGAYSSSTSYSVGTIVYYTASSVTKLYKCIQAGKNKTPSSQTAYWQVVHTTPTATAFKPDKIYWYNTTTTISAGSVIGANTLMSVGYNATNMVVSNFDTDIPAYRMIYLCGTYDKATGLFTLRGGGTTGTDYYTLVPENTANITLSSYFTNGYDYILVGASYSSANSMHLREDHPMYHFDGTNLVPYDTWNENRIEALIPDNYITSITSSDITNALGYTPYNGSTNPNGYTTNTGTVIGSSLTSNKIVIGNGTNNIKVSDYTVNELKEIAEGKTASYVIATKACITGTEDTNGNFDNVTQIKTATSGGTILNLGNMNIGDNIYVLEVDVPDYWVAAKSTSNGETTLSLSKLETTKVTVPTSYVSSVNGSTGAITNVAKTNADNSFSVAQTFKDITLYSASGDSPRLTFQRGTLTDSYNDWSFYDSAGLFYIQQKGSGNSSWETRATLTQSGANFVGTLQQGGVNVVTTSGQQALTNKTYNGYTLGAACAKALASSINSSDTGLVTAQQVANALANVGGGDTNLIKSYVVMNIDPYFVQFDGDGNLVETVEDDIDSTYSNSSSWGTFYEYFRQTIFKMGCFDSSGTLMPGTGPNTTVGYFIPSDPTDNNWMSTNLKSYFQAGNVITFSNIDSFKVEALGGYHSEAECTMVVTVYTKLATQYQLQIYCGTSSYTASGWKLLGGGSVLYQHDITMTIFKGDYSDFTVLQARIINGVSTSQNNVGFYNFMNNNAFVKGGVLLGAYTDVVNQKGPVSVSLVGTSIVVAGGADEYENLYFRYINGSLIITTDDPEFEDLERDQNYANYWGISITDTVTTL